jgi:hypothetical protein
MLPLTSPKCQIRDLVKRWSKLFDDDLSESRILQIAIENGYPVFVSKRYQQVKVIAKLKEPLPDVDVRKRLITAEKVTSNPYGEIIRLGTETKEWNVQIPPRDGRRCSRIDPSVQILADIHPGYILLSDRIVAELLCGKSAPIHFVMIN